MGGCYNSSVVTTKRFAVTTDRVSSVTAERFIKIRRKEKDMTLPTIFDWIVKYAGGVVTIVTAAALLATQKKYLVKKLSAGDTDTRLKALEHTLSQEKKVIGTMLHSLFFAACRRAINRGYTTHDELEDIAYLYESYKALGFNGYGDQLYKKVTELKTDKELTERKE